MAILDLYVHIMKVMFVLSSFFVILNVVIVTDY